MPIIRTESLIRRVIDEAFNQGNLEVVDTLSAPIPFHQTKFAGALNGPGDLKWQIVMLRTAFPDLHCSVEDEIIMADKQVARWTLRGTHWGPYLGSRPTGKSVELQGIILARVEEGKIVAYWLLTDQYGLLQQLGIIPA